MKATHTERENWRTQESSTEFWYSKLNETEQFVIRFTVVVAVVFSVAYIIANIDVLEIVRVINDFAANVITEVISIAVTVLIIERLNQRRATNQQKSELILQMGSLDNGFASDAARRLRHYGWLTDGSLQGADLTEANLARVQLWQVSLGTAHMPVINLEGANLGLSNLKESILYQANLRGANLSGANLQGADLAFANLQETILEVANLEKAILRETNLQGADLREANLRHAILRNATHIDTATFDTDTILPNGDKWYKGYDLTIFTDPDHPNFWEPKWVKEQHEQADK